MAGQRNILFSIICLCACIACMDVHAEAITRLSPENHSFISLYGGLGYSAMTPSSQEVKMMNGGGAHLGVNYKLLYNRFVFTLGVDGDFAMTTAKPTDATLSLNLKDGEGDPFVMDALERERKEVSKCVNVNIPLLVGAEYGHFYFLVGAKFGMDVYGVAHTEGLLTTTATYSRFPDELADMLNHGMYRDLPVSADKTLKLSPKVAGHVELGARVDNFRNKLGREFLRTTRYYVAVFAEYGILARSISGQDRPRLELLDTGGQSFDFAVSPEYLARENKGVRLRELNVGVKFTASFELPKKKICIHCDK